MKNIRGRSVLIICNGEMPPRHLIAPLLRRKPFIVCADGGANKVRPYGIIPDVIIGDLDSITDRTRQYFSSVPILRDPDQETTDLEKVLNFLLENRAGSAVVIGATGDRPDHTLANLSILLKYHRRIALQYFDERCTIEVVHKRAKFSTVAGQQISLVPMGKCTGITTTGLKYPLKNESLAPGVREGVSNAALGTSVTVTVRTGPLLLFRIHPSVTR